MNGCDCGRWITVSSTIRQDQRSCFLHQLWTPGGRDALLALADEMDIPRHWYHGTPGLEHIDIPVRQLNRILTDPRVTVVSPRDIVRAQRGA